MRCAWWCSRLAVLAATALSTQALALTLAFVPVTQVVALGQTALVEVLVLDTLAGAPPSLGAYDIDVAFDDAILADVDFAFGALLGSPLSITAVDVSIPGLVNFAEVSLLDPGDLDLLQPDAFALGTLSFTAVALGTSPLVFASALLGDAFGAALPVILTTGSITVVAVATPGPAVLLA